LGIEKVNRAMWNHVTGMSGLGDRLQWCRFGIFRLMMLDVFYVQQNFNLVGMMPSQRFTAQLARERVLCCTR